MLLKNEQLLPLSRKLETIAVIGPTADEIMSLLGNYYGTPAHPVTIAARNSRGGAAQDESALRARRRSGGRPRRSACRAGHRVRVSAAGSGLRRTGSEGRVLQQQRLHRRARCSRASIRASPSAGIAVSPTDDLVAQRRAAGDMRIGRDDFCVRWTGQLFRTVSRSLRVSVGADDGFRLYLDGKLVARRLGTDAARCKARARSSTSRREARIRRRSSNTSMSMRDAEVRLAWQPPGAKPLFEEALDAARSRRRGGFRRWADGRCRRRRDEGELSRLCGRRSHAIFACLRRSRSCSKRCSATGKPVVLVLTTGSALAVDWAKANLPAILVAWYPGQRGGNAVADVLFGNANPAVVYRSRSTRPIASCRHSMTTACMDARIATSRARRSIRSDSGFLYAIRVFGFEARSQQGRERWNGNGFCHDQERRRCRRRRSGSAVLASDCAQA